jgi:hypothetical protein
MQIQESEEFFSNGLPVACRFTNGWFCSVCEEVTEHKEQRNALGLLERKCCRCGHFKKRFFTPEQILCIRKRSRENDAFKHEIRQLVDSTEFSALQKVTSRVCFCSVVGEMSWRWFKGNHFHGSEVD